MKLTEKQVNIYSRLASKGKSKRLRKKAIKRLDDHNFIKHIESVIEVLRQVTM